MRLILQNERLKKQIYQLHEMNEISDQVNPKVSIISIALKTEEFQPLIDVLEKQSFQDFEFIGEAGGSIPEAWNKAIQRARGEILVFTETDARPVNNHWLEELVASADDEHTVVKGLEVTHQTWDLANVAIYRNVFNSFQFNEEFKWAEDMELFCRLRAGGYRLLQIEKAPVIHLKKPGSKHAIRRAFRYGMYHARLKHRYGNTLKIGNALTQIRLIATSGLNLLGYLLGYFIYLPEHLHRTNTKFKEDGKPQERNHMPSD